VFGKIEGVTIHKLHGRLHKLYIRRAITLLARVAKYELEQKAVRQNEHDLAIKGISHSIYRIKQEVKNEQTD
jgi:hypothetical protein